MASPEGMERDTWKVKAVIFLGILVLLFGAYMPVLQGYYVYHDDWYYWNMTKWEPRSHPVAEFLTKTCGRPVTPFLVCYHGSLFDDLEGANAARSITVVLVSVLAFLVYTWLRRGAFCREHALLLVIGMYTLPAFQVVIGTVCNSHLVIACLVALAGAALARRGSAEFDRSTGRMPRKAWITAALFGMATVALVCLALSIYPPAAMLYWFLIGISLLQVDARSPGRWIRRFGYEAGAHVVATLLYFIYLKSLPIAADGSYTLAVNTAYWSKLVWLVNEVLVNALNFWKLWPSRTLALYSGVLILAGWVLAVISTVWKARKNRPLARLAIHCGFRYGLVLALLPLSYTANLAAKFNYAAYRTLLVLGPFLLLLAAWSVWTVMGLILPHRIRRAAMTAVLLSGGAVGIWTAHYNLQNYCVLSTTIEVRYIKSAIRNAGPDGYDKILIIKPDPAPDYSFVAPTARYDEFGVPATGFGADIPQIVICAIRELNLERPGKTPFRESRPEIVNKSEYKGQHDEGVLVIDMTRLHGFY